MCLPCKTRKEAFLSTDMLLKVLLFIMMLSVMLFATVEKIALVIGNNVGLSDEEPLKFAADDAEKVYNVLLSLGDIEKGRSYLYLNKSREQVEAAFQEISGRVKEIKRNGSEVEVILYFSGHGSDNAFHLNGQELSVAFIREYFDSMQADLKIMIADACYSGALLVNKGGALAKPYNIRMDNALKVRGSAIITSSSAGELSHESRDLSGSLFTHYFVSGLLGAADMDNDRRITLWEAYTFARINTLKRGERIKNFSQNPSFDFDIHGTENVVLTRLDHGKAFLQFRGLKDGVYAVVNAASRSKVAEVFIANGQEVTLALSNEVYVVQKTTTSTVYLGNFDLTWGGETVVMQSSLKPYPLDVLAAKGFDNIRYQPSFSGFRVTQQSSFPRKSETMTLYEAVYQYTQNRVSILSGVGYGNERSEGRFLEIRRNTIAPFMEARYAFRNSTRYRLFGGISGRALFIRQEAVRYQEDEILRGGYPPIPVVWAHVVGFFGTAGVQVNLPWSLSIIGQWSSGVYLSTKTDGSADYYLRSPWSVTVGMRF